MTNDIDPGLRPVDAYLRTLCDVVQMNQTGRS